ncbi:MAG: hypothetical protein HON70_05110 [Lentisphaerae bacterium]|nr:hypothetical protein [Lentisphaerota bacterium]
MHRPNSESGYRTSRLRHGLRATWTGLSNGLQRFPEETLIIEAWEDSKTGALKFRADATSPSGGVYGVQVPVANLHADHAFYVPSFGGVMYDSGMKPGLTTLGGAPFWEAPVIGVEGRQGSLSVWTEDLEFHPNFCFLHWSGKTFSLAIEHLNLMPFEEHRETSSVTWQLDVFDGGWVDAMTPYRDWYAQTFASETAARDAVKWADQVRIIIDHWDKGDPAVLRSLAALFEPETVLFHEWNARAPDFDHDLPDWTPRAGYADRVRDLKAFGFRTMAYVNTYCVNVGSPVYERDQVETFALTRKHRSFYKYTSPPDDLGTAKPGRLLYLDPLSPRWRQYHTDMMIQWYKETGTDANYEDVGGTVGDFGNGAVEGLFGAQGGVEQFRELLRRNPHVAMAAEYAPTPIAFAVRWPLRFQQVWGGESTRTFWMRRQRPVSTFIHGPTQAAWVPVLRAESNFLQHVVVACSDALGGVAQFPGTRAAMESNQGILAHMKWRAQLFSRKRLIPHFTPARTSRELACMYQDREGGVYEYHTNATVQRMIAPDGRDAYARITGLNTFDTELNLPGWPAVTGRKIIGLNPGIRYALVPGVPDRTAVSVTALPSGIQISRYYETPKATVLTLAPVAGGDATPEGVVGFTLRKAFKAALVNGVPQELPKDADGKPATGDIEKTVTFPAAFVFLKTAAQKLKHDEYAGDGRETGRYLMVASGLDRGGEYIPKYRANFAVPGEKASVPFTFVNYGNDAEVTLDYLVTVPGPDSGLRIYQKNRSNKYGNATIGKLYINGTLVRAYDVGPRPNPDWKDGMPKNKKSIWDTDYHAWTLPVGTYAGQTILISIATDSKASNNSDNHWWSRPKFIKIPAQEPTFVRLAGGKAVPEEAPRVTGP